MNSRERLLAACKMEALNRPPLWVMRQAGRYLPEYRAIKEQYSFVEMVKLWKLVSHLTIINVKLELNRVSHSGYMYTLY